MPRSKCYVDLRLRVNHYEQYYYTISLASFRRKESQHPERNLCGS